MIDQYFNYFFGHLEYRSLSFESALLDCGNYQGVAVINYISHEVPYTRIIEHKHFEFGVQPKTVITREYPEAWQLGNEAYYPINDERNNSLYKQCKDLAKAEDKIIFGGRLGHYRYYDMDQTISSALELAEQEFT